MQAATGSQCKEIKRGVTWALLDSLKTSPAAAFWIICKGLIVHGGCKWSLEVARGNTLTVSYLPHIKEAKGCDSENSLRSPRVQNSLSQPLASLIWGRESQTSAISLYFWNQHKHPFETLCLILRKPRATTVKTRSAHQGCKTLNWLLSKLATSLMVCGICTELLGQDKSDKWNCWSTIQVLVSQPQTRSHEWPDCELITSRDYLQWKSS